MLEHLRDIDALVTAGVKALIEDEAVENSQQFVGRGPAEECFELVDQESGIFVYLQEAYD